MTRQAIEFLHNQQYLTDADRSSDSTRAMVLADKCQCAAAAQGLSVDDMPEWQSLDRIIYLKMLPPDPKTRGQRSSGPPYEVK